MNLREGTLWIQYIKCKEKLFLDITLFSCFYTTSQACVLPNETAITWEGRKSSNEAYRFLNILSSNFQILTVTTSTATSAAGLSSKQLNALLCSYQPSLQVCRQLAISHLSDVSSKGNCKCRSRKKKCTFALS